MRSRTTRRALIVAATAGITLVATGTPALAREQDAGSDPGESLSPLATLLIFVGIPVGLFLLIALLVSAGSIARGTRYRPDRVWDATPVEFGIPAQPAPAGAALTRSAGADAGTATATPPAGTDDDQSGGGGISARW